ncbi:MAG: hypothetical protein K2L03_09055 [Bacteroidales bacterium]|nr:hypothetical protein [Bacteroidales bacterium]
MKARQILDGSTMLRDLVQKHWSLLLLIFALCLVLIANNYLTERMVRETNALKKEVKELRFRQLSVEAAYMRLSRQSSVARMLDSTGIKESVVPPVRLSRNDDGNCEED